MLDRLTLLPLPILGGERVTLRESRESDIADRLRHPIDPEEEDGYGSAWRREWDGRRYHTREYLTARREPPDKNAYTWMVEYGGHCIGSAGLRVDAGQHCATYSVGLFVAATRGRGLGREITRLVLSWGFDTLGLHRVQLEVLADNIRAMNCYLACGFRREGIRREAQLYPDGWKDLVLMGILRSEYQRLERHPRLLQLAVVWLEGLRRAGRAGSPDRPAGRGGPGAAGRRGPRAQPDLGIRLRSNRRCRMLRYDWRGRDTKQSSPFVQMGSGIFAKPAGHRRHRLARR